MRRSLLAVILVWLFVNITSAQDKEKEIAIHYIEKIADLRNKVSTKNLEFIIESVHGNDEEALETKRRAVVYQIEECRKELDKMYSHAGDAKLKNRCLKILEQYNEVYSNDYLQTLRLKKNRENSFEDMKKYLESIEQAEKKVLDAESQFEREFDEFVEKYNSPFNRNLQLEKTMDIISQVNEYNRKIYLVYFKIIKLNRTFIDGVNAKDFKITSTARQELIKGCEEQLQNLDSIGPFKEDKSLLDATIKFVKFYRTLSQKDYEELEFYVQKIKSITKNDFEKMKAIMEEYGKESKKFHDKFNQENTKFLQTYIPKSVKD